MLEEPVNARSNEVNILLTELSAIVRRIEDYERDNMKNAIIAKDRLISHFQGITSVLQMFTNKFHLILSDEEIKSLVDTLNGNASLCKEELGSQYNGIDPMLSAAKCQAALNGLPLAKITYPNTVDTSITKDEIDIISKAANETILALSNQQLSKNDYANIAISQIMEKIESENPAISPARLQLFKKIISSDKQDHHTLTDAMPAITEAETNSILEQSSVIISNIKERLKLNTLEKSTSEEKNIIEKKNENQRKADEFEKLMTKSVLKKDSDGKKIVKEDSNRAKIINLYKANSVGFDDNLKEWLELKNLKITSEQAIKKLDKESSLRESFMDFALLSDIRKPNPELFNKVMPAYLNMPDTDKALQKLMQDRTQYNQFINFYGTLVENKKRGADTLKLAMATQSKEEQETALKEFNRIIEAEAPLLAKAGMGCKPLISILANDPLRFQNMVDLYLGSNSPNADQRAEIRADFYEKYANSKDEQARFQAFTTQLGARDPAKLDHQIFAIMAYGNNKNISDKPEVLNLALKAAENPDAFRKLALVYNGINLDLEERRANEELSKIAQKWRNNPQKIAEFLEFYDKVVDNYNSHIQAEETAIKKLPNTTPQIQDDAIELAKNNAATLIFKVIGRNRFNNIFLTKQLLKDDTNKENNLLENNDFRKNLEAVEKYWQKSLGLDSAEKLYELLNKDETHLKGNFTLCLMYSPDMWEKISQRAADFKLDMSKEKDWRKLQKIAALEGEIREKENEIREKGNEARENGGINSITEFDNFKTNVIDPICKEAAKSGNFKVLDLAIAAVKNPVDFQKKVVDHEQNTYNNSVGVKLLRNQKDREEFLEYGEGKFTESHYYTDIIKRSIFGKKSLHYKRQEQITSLSDKVPVDVGVGEIKNNQPISARQARDLQKNDPSYSR